MSVLHPLDAVEISGTTGGPFRLNDPIAIDLDALSPEDWLVRAPAAGEPLMWLTGAGCDACEGAAWCTLTIANGTLVSVWPAAFTRETFRAAHVVSGGGAQHIAEHELDRSEIRTKDQVLAALERL